MSYLLIVIASVALIVVAACISYGEGFDEGYKQGDAEGRRELRLSCDHKCERLFDENVKSTDAYISFRAQRDMLINLIKDDRRFFKWASSPNQQTWLKERASKRLRLIDEALKECSSNPSHNHTENYALEA